MAWLHFYHQRLFLILGLFSSISFGAEFPSDIRKCKAGDTECIGEVMVEVLQKYPHGHKGLNIPDLEPFHVNSITITQGEDRPVSIDLKMTNLDFYGFATQIPTKVIGFEKDIANSKYEVHSIIPNMTIRGQYEAKGSVLVLPIQGKGNIDITLDNVEVMSKIKPRVNIKNGKKYLGIDKLRINMNITKMQSKLTNLFNGDKVLEETMNMFLNEHWQSIWEEMRPSINNAMAEILKSVFEKMFSHLSYDDIFLTD